METSDERNADKVSVLIVDDEVEVAKAFSRGLSMAGYETCVANGAIEALQYLKSRRFDVLMTDIHMPGMQGDELQCIARTGDPDLAVLMITAAQDITTAVECLKGGAYDYMVKPVPLAEIVVRVGKAVERRRLVIENRDYHVNLEIRVAEQAERIRKLFQHCLESLIQALEAKDENTRNHSARVSDMASKLAVRLRSDDMAFALRVKVGALFHDIGKIGVPEAILNKAEKLSPDEMQQICRHPEIGEQILRPLFGDSDILAIIRSHHEQTDGSGYPDGLRGEAIPFGARIVAVADAFDAMTCTRAYRQPMPLAQVTQILREGAGAQWDETVVATLIAILEEATPQPGVGPAGQPDATAASPVESILSNNVPSKPTTRYNRPVIIAQFILDGKATERVQKKVDLLLSKGRLDFILDLEGGDVCPR